MAISPHQVTASHGDTCTEPEGLLQVALQGTPHRVTGTVQGSTPVLRELNGVTFKQPAPLVGPLLIYRAKTSETNMLPTLAGKLLVSPQAKEQLEGSPQSAWSQKEDNADRALCAETGGVVWLQGWGICNAVTPAAQGLVGSLSLEDSDLT